MNIPRGPEDVTPAWLGSAVGADVTDVDVTPIGTGQTGATYRVSATYAGSPDLPATFAVKLSAQDDAVRERVALGYRSEVEYYARVADRMRIPDVTFCFYCDISDDGADFVLVLADMAPAVQGDQIAGCTPSGGAAGRGSACGTARPELVRPGMDGPARIAMPKPGDDAAARDSVRSRRWRAGSSSTNSATTSAMRIRRPLRPQCLW